LKKYLPFQKALLFIAVREKCMQLRSSSPFKQRLLEQAKTYEQKNKNEKKPESTENRATKKWLKRGLAEKTSAEEET